MPKDIYADWTQFLQRKSKPTNYKWKQKRNVSRQRKKSNAVKIWIRNHSFFPIFFILFFFSLSVNHLSKARRFAIFFVDGWDIFLGVFLLECSVSSQVHISLFLSRVFEFRFESVFVYPTVYIFLWGLRLILQVGLWHCFLWWNVRKHVLCEKYRGNEYSFTQSNSQVCVMFLNSDKKKKKQL